MQNNIRTRSRVYACPYCNEKNILFESVETKYIKRTCSKCKREYVADPPEEAIFVGYDNWLNR